MSSYISFRSASTLLAGLCMSITTMAHADNVTIAEAIESAVLGNPEVSAMFHDFQSGLEGQKIGRGALLPEINASTWTGKEWRSQMDHGRSENWNRNGYELSLRQLLFDGFSTINNVRQLGFEKLASYYTLKSKVDGIAQDASAAYLDVQRYREQVELAENNYKMHRDIFSQISERSDSGVGRGVDEVQAKARLALAQTNVMTASGNLNDVIQRYQRLVGKTPTETMAAAPDVSADLPKNPENFNDSIRVNPQVLSKQAMVQAAEYAKASAKGRFAPTVELKASTGKDANVPNDQANRNVHSSNVQVIASINLYRGGADSARLRQAAAQTYSARDVRDYTCRNVQQELSIAWNNVERLRNQMPFLEEHEREIAQVRVAYSQQFQIGQRTLLDLLDTENELFDARRALTNGVYDLRQAEYKWLSLSHKLLASMGLADPYADQPDEASKLQFPDEILQACVSPLPNTSNLQAIDVDYKSGMKPPVLKPAGGNSNISNWN